MAYEIKNMSTGPNIVTDSLDYVMDIANPKSYDQNSSILIDLKGNSNGTITGANYNSDHSGSLVFEGISDYVTLPVMSQYDGLSKLTIDCWVYLNYESTIYRVIISGYDDASTSGWSISLRPDGGIEVFMGITYQYRAYTVGSLVAREWYHLVVVYDGTLAAPLRLKLYINGVLQTWTSIWGNIVTSVPTAVSPANIGQYGRSSSYWNGRISNIKIYTKAFVQDEVTQNYDALKNRYSAVLYNSTFNPITDISNNIALYQITQYDWDVSPNKPEATGRKTNGKNIQTYLGAWFNQMDTQSDDSLLGVKSFTASTDGYNISGGGVACTMSYNETVNGSDGWLKLEYPSSGDTTNYLYTSTNSHLTGGVVARTKFQVYVEGTTVATHLDLRDRFDYTWHYYVPLVSGLNTFEIIAPHSTYRWDPKVVLIKQGSGTSMGTTIAAQGENIYMKNVEYWSINTTHAFWGELLGSMTKVNNLKPYSDGVADYLYNNQGGDTLSPYSSGTMIFYFKDIEDTGVDNLIFSMGDSTADNYFDLEINTSDELVITRVTGAGSVVTSTFPNTIIRGYWSKFIVKTDGLSYTASQNGTDLGTPTNDNGDWWDYPSGTNRMNLFKKTSSATYYQGSMGYMQFTTTITSITEDNQIIEYIEYNTI